jgi:Ca-activated chloride channel homolog
MKRKLYILALAALCTLCFLCAPAVMAGSNEVTQGSLRVMDKDGKVQSECPLTHTDVKAEISGFIARVTVKQSFHNPMKEKIEAVYIFPLPSRSAVDDMVMKIGSRTIKGEIKKKEEARKIYEAAKRQGHVASLLEQERPNIFTQSVANIMPGENVDIVISYVEYLNYQDGVYEFSFPMVVGPRYIPGNATGAKGTGWAPDTDAVPDASRITPQVTPKGTRAGHDISLSVNIDAGVPVQKIRSVLHKVTIGHQEGSPKATVSIDQLDNIPNKDFILQYETAGKGIEDAMLYHMSKKDGGFFSLILQPPLKPAKAEITPKEMIFVLDTSGSQMGWPIEKAKETMKYCIENMNEGDTFNLIAFSNNLDRLFTAPQPNTKENREKALDYLAHRLGGGGTEMMPAVMAALEPPPDKQRLRIVCFETDGYVGNDMQIADAVKKNIGSSRFFVFGCGNSVNRYLLDKMAQLGRGEVEYVTLNRHGDEVAEAFQRKIGTPLLTDVSIDWGNLPVSEVYPKQQPDLFSGKPLTFTGRYKGSGHGDITIRGKVAGTPCTRKLSVSLPSQEPSHDVLASLWARTRIEDLMDSDLSGIQNGKPQDTVKDEITKLGLEFRLMTQFTSFVAVEEKIVTEGGVPRTVAVPVEMPDGVSYEGVFGEQKAKKETESYNAPGSGAASYRSTGGTLSTAQSNVSGKTATPMPSVSRARRYAADEEMDGTPAPKKPEEKFDSSLKDLAQSAKQGTIDNKIADGIEVKNGRVHLIVTMAYVSAKALSQLKALGFDVETSSALSKVVRGTLPVEKLQDLARLTCVNKIEPYVTGKKNAMSSVMTAYQESLMEQALSASMTLQRQASMLTLVYPVPTAE